MGRPRIIDDAPLLAIAREVFVKDGAFGSTREIAQRAGVSEAALFKRFGTKAGLFLAAMAPPAVDPAEIVRRAEALDDARAGVALIADLTLAYFREALPVVLPLIQNPLIGPDAVHRHFGHGQASRLTEAIAGYLAGEERQGRLGPVQPFAAAALMVASLHSVALFELMGFHGGAVPPRGVDGLIEALWTGLAPHVPDSQEPSR
jgi:AcrR family transcriptional regulator